MSRFKILPEDIQKKILIELPYDDIINSCESLPEIVGYCNNINFCA